MSHSVFGTYLHYKLFIIYLKFKFLGHLVLYLATPLEQLLWPPYFGGHMASLRT